MKDLLIPVLADVHARASKNVPTTKKINVDVDISDISANDLAVFMADNNIPRDAVFGMIYNGDYGVAPCLSYDKTVPVDSNDIDNHIKRKFNLAIFKSVMDVLVDNGYKRDSYHSGYFRKFGKLTIYDMYTANNIDMIAEYYSLIFKKI